MNRLEEEIEKIKYELSVTIPEELQNATDSTDASETSDYSEILSRQNLLSIRLSQLVKRLNALHHVELKNISKDKVGIGSLVTLFCQDTNVSFKVKLVSGEISDLLDNNIMEITVNSPMGKSLYNKSINENVYVRTPGGIKHYKITHLRTIHEMKNDT